MTNMKTYVIEPKIYGLNDGMVTIEKPKNSSDPVQISIVDSFNRNPVKEGLGRIRQPVLDILAKHNGTVENDGSGYGDPNHPGQFASFMVVTVPEAAALEIKALLDVSNVFENRIAHPQMGIEHPHAGPALSH